VIVLAAVAVPVIVNTLDEVVPPKYKLDHPMLALPKFREPAPGAKLWLTITLAKLDKDVLAPVVVACQLGAALVPLEVSTYPEVEAANADMALAELAIKIDPAVTVVGYVTFDQPGVAPDIKT